MKYDIKNLSLREFTDIVNDEQKTDRWAEHERYITLYTTKDKIFDYLFIFSCFVLKSLE